jgi:hypothetical protein
MTVEEAKKKICPFIQRADLVLGTEEYRYGDNSEANIRCICDDCMAWYWENKFDENTKKYVKELSTSDGFCRRLIQ